MGRIVTTFRSHFGESAVVGNTHHTVGQIARHGNGSKGIFAVLQHGFEPGLFFLTAIQSHHSGITQQGSNRLVFYRPRDRSLDHFPTHIGNRRRNPHRIAQFQINVHGIDGNIHLGRTVERSFLFTCGERSHTEKARQKEYKAISFHVSNVL